MEQGKIEVGVDYGYREVPKQTEPLQRVRVLERVRTKWRVEWIDPNPGLQDFIRGIHLVVEWRDRKVFLRDEASWNRLLESSDTAWSGFDHPVSHAAEWVLNATAELAEIGKSGVLSLTPAALERIAARAGVEAKVEPPGFKDRSGVLHLGFSQALALAEAFAAAEPTTVLLDIDEQERNWEIEARYSYNTGIVRLFQEYRAGWALVRQWSGWDRAKTVRDGEIERLARVIRNFELMLRREGHEELARSLQRNAKIG